MSAMDTSLRVLIWATDRPQSPAPRGVLGDTAALAAPPLLLRSAVARLAAVAAARLLIDAPPFGGSPDLGCELILIAAAIGAAQEPAAVELLRAAGRVTGGYDLVARHALAAPAVRQGVGAETFRDALREASPLTGLLDHPGASAEVSAEEVLDDFILPHRQGRIVLVQHFGRRPESVEQSGWRGGLLQRLRPHEPELVLDVYEAAIIRHRPALVEWVADARRGLGFAAAGAGRIGPIAKWWQALAYLERGRSAAALKTRFGLMDYGFGIDLYRTAWGLGVVG